MRLASCCGQWQSNLRRISSLSSPKPLIPLPNPLTNSPNTAIHPHTSRSIITSTMAQSTDTANGITISPTVPAPHSNGITKATPKPLNHLMTSLPTTIFTVMSKLANEHGAVNLGQGFPDDEGPEEMKKIAGETLYSFHNQYPPMMGVPELRQAVAKHSERYQGISVDWQTEAVITVGATEAIAAAFIGMLNEGDEVIMFDPMYDSYVSMCQRSGGVIRPIKLQPPDFHFSKEDLAAAFNEKTKLIIVNTPHNPSGKVYTEEELQFIADLCIKHGVYAMCDEVYEHLTFHGSKHVSLRALPGMKDLAFRIGSAGKTFSFTAWKIGWATGPANVIHAIAQAHSFLVFTVASSLQRAVAHGLDNCSDYYLGMGQELAAKRAFLEQHLPPLGFKVLPAAGTYFLVADVSVFLKEGETDVEFCKRLTVEGGVTLIPVSPFYVGEGAPTNLVRFCFCKDDSKLQAAIDRLHKYLTKS